jgi:hypothetical protein
MIPNPKEVTLWMESKGYNSGNSIVGRGYFAQRGNVTIWRDFDVSASEYCYQRGETRTDVDGVVLNESGNPAKKGDVILRETITGYPIQRMGDNGVPMKKLVVRQEKEENDD